MFARVVEIEGKVDFSTKNSLFEGDFDAGFDITATGLALLPMLSTATAKKAVENIAQAQITKIKVNILTLSTAITAAKRVTTGAANPGMAELIVALAFI